MARIPTVREDDPTAIPEAREFIERTGTLYGDTFNFMRILANHPRQGNAVLDFALSVRARNTLTPVLTELAFMTASVVNQCHY